jgi:hypothetical protein
MTMVVYGTGSGSGVTADPVSVAAAEVARDILMVGADAGNDGSPPPGPWLSAAGALPSSSAIQALGLGSPCAGACSLVRRVKELNVWCARQFLCEQVKAVNDNLVVPYAKACMHGMTEGGGVAALTGGGVLSGALGGCTFEGFLAWTEGKGEHPTLDKAVTAYNIVDLTIAVARLKTMLAKAIYESRYPIYRGPR